jgi:predicted  nucleic acid-binding Zn-ribbon protein
MTKPKLLTKREVATIRRRIKRHQDRIAHHRDALRDIAAELDSNVDALERAHEELECACDHLSEYQ